MALQIRVICQPYYPIKVYLPLQITLCAKKFSAHDKKIKKSDKTRHNSNFFDELNHAKSYQT